jgi:hypothetical protein
MTDENKIIQQLIAMHNSPPPKMGWNEQTTLQDACKIVAELRDTKAELLAALEEVLEDWRLGANPNETKSHERAIKAIAKTKGEQP